MLSIISILILLTIVFKTFKYYSYWRMKGVIGPVPLPLFGNYLPVILGYKTEAELLREIYETFPSDYIGIYKGMYRVLLIKNPEVIKQVLVKDFDNFNVRCIEKSIGMYSQSLFVMKGDKNWKKWRRLFTPGMLSDKIQKMIPFINICLEKYLNNVDEVIKYRNTHNIRDLQDYFVLDVFNKLIFNMDFDGGYNGVEEIKLFVDSKLEISVKHKLDLICPEFAKKLIEVIENDDANCALSEFVNAILRDIENKGPKRNNFIEFMVEMKVNGKTRKDKELPQNFNDSAIIQQSLSFFLTAVESTSRVMAFVLYELARNKKIQDKCFEEICTVLNTHNNTFSLDSLSDMNYLQMVIDETMRKHSLAQVIDRKCVSEYTFPESHITIDDGTFVYVPVHGLHNDPKYFPKPEEFIPERFSDENKVNILQYVYLPFGDGPRMCIGVRLAKTVMLLGLAGFLKRYAASATQDSEIIYNPKRIRFIAPLKTLRINIEPRNS